MFFVIVIVAVVGYIAGRKRDEIIAFCKGLGGQIREKMNGSSDGGNDTHAEESNEQIGGSMDAKESKRYDQLIERILDCYEYCEDTNDFEVDEEKSMRHLDEIVSSTGRFYPEHMDLLKRIYGLRPNTHPVIIDYLGNTLIRLTFKKHDDIKKQTDKIKIPGEKLAIFFKKYKRIELLRTDVLPYIVTRWLNCSVDEVKRYGDDAFLFSKLKKEESRAAIDEVFASKDSLSPNIKAVLITVGREIGEPFMNEKDLNSRVGLISQDLADLIKQGGKIDFPHYREIADNLKSLDDDSLSKAIES